MKQQLSSRTDVATDIGQEVVKSLIKEPVKEAVQEALVEQDHATEQVKEDTAEESTEDDSGALNASRILVLAGLVGAVLAVRRYRDKLSDREGIITGDEEESTDATQVPADTDDSESRSTTVVGSAGDDDMD